MKCFKQFQEAKPDFNTPHSRYQTDFQKNLSQMHIYKIVLKSEIPMNLEYQTLINWVELSVMEHKTLQ